MTLPRLAPQDFPAFFQTVHGLSPFPWQRRLAAYVAEHGNWPPVLDLPTGSGKTAALDIAVFHLALEAQRPSERRAPMRIVFVVDRRLIVDAARERADRIAARLQAALDDDDRGVLGRVARRLASFSGTNGPPLVACTLRGGLPREDDWARTPCQPTILCSTIDQVGSRLLFRGYGVSDSMKPVHAGLLGTDCLVLLDEAHLSEAFRQTLGWVDRYRRDPWATRDPGPWSFVTLSATPNDRGAAFTLDREDEQDEALAKRLVARKPARLVKADVETSDVAGHARAVADVALGLAGSGSDQPEPKVIATVVNRVGLARACHAALAALATDKGIDADAVLLIGRTRDVDRARLLREYGPRVLAGRSPAGRTLFVTATQCIEAGADFDFDALVTQVAPLDALRQRFGRLNRLGLRDTADAAIVACRDEVAARADDVLYGTRPKATWDWLASHAVGKGKGGVRRKKRPDAEVDFGIHSMQKLLGRKTVADLVSEKPNAPVMMPAYVDMWAQTSPIPATEPDVAPFLHGAPCAADVQIVWRADISLDTDDDVARSIDVLSLMPPRAGETVSVPIGAARSWLAKYRAADIADVEGPSAATGEVGRRGRPALRWCGPESDATRVVRARHIRPGDVLVVPCAIGGCDRFGWNPDSTEPVSDVADEAARPFSRRRFVLRLHPRLLESALAAESSGPGEGTAELAASIWGRVSARVAEQGSELGSAALAEDICQVSGLPESWRDALLACTQARGLWLARPYDPEDAETVSGIAFVAPRGIPSGAVPSELTAEAITEEDDVGSFRSKAVALDVHSRDVAAMAEKFVSSLGLAAELSADVALAAVLHDEGKRDSRFQAYLHLGDRFRALTQDAPLAKSGRRFESRAAERKARAMSNLPRRWRHEADSVRRVLGDQALLRANDPELVLWLVGTHHGYGRPLYPHADPDHRGPQDLDHLIGDRDWAQLFESLRERYGTWALAWLEAIVRLADHRASEEEDLR